MDFSSIQINALYKLKKIFQKDIPAIIDWFLVDSAKKIMALETAIQKNNYKQIIATLKELRAQSNDIGAIDFAYLCLNIELTLTEYRCNSIQRQWEQLTVAYTGLKAELVRLHASIDSKPIRPISNLARLANEL